MIRRGSADLSAGDGTLRAVEAVRDAFRPDQPVGAALDRAEEIYRNAILLTLYEDSRLALALVDEFDQRIPAERYPFGPDDRLSLGGPHAILLCLTVFPQDYGAAKRRAKVLRGLS